MTMRVCALYGHSRKSQIFLMVCLFLEQVTCAVPTVAFMRGFGFRAVQGLEPGGSACVYEPTALNTAQADASNVACLLYQFILFSMVAFSLLKRIKEPTYPKAWSTKELYTLLVQEQILYFIFMLVAISLGIVSYKEPMISSAVQEYMAGDAALATVTKLMCTFSSCIVGPRMMLSIHRFDADQLRGGTSTESEARLETLQFAAHPSDSEEDTNNV